MSQNKNDALTPLLQEIQAMTNQLPADALTLIFR